MNMDNLFKCDCSKYKLKRAYESIYNFVSNNLHNSEYENILKSVETLKNVKQKHYVLELYDPIYKSLESYCFSLYKDDTGYYTVYNNCIKHFHKMENAIKYQCSKHIVNSKLSTESFNYICLENSRIDKKESFKEYINRSYSIKKRIFI